MNLKERLKNWTYMDFAAFQLAVCLGLMKDGDFQVKTKHIFGSRNILGNLLYAILASLQKEKILQYNSNEMQYRWNKSYKWNKKQAFSFNKTLGIDGTPLCKIFSEVMEAHHSIANSPLLLPSKKKDKK